MGYRFTLETANIVANLTFGKVFSVYDALTENEANYYGFLDFLKNFEDNFFTGDELKNYELIKQIRKKFESFSFQDFFNKYDEDRKPNFFSVRRESLLDILYKLSCIFSECKIKALLLPPLKNNKKDYDFMYSKNLLHHLVSYHPGKSCLILQPQEPYTEEHLMFFDAFPNFEIALRQIDRWPAILLWDDTRNPIFIPVSSYDDVLAIFQRLRYDENGFWDIYHYFNNNTPSNNYYFHLSDLHFGSKQIKCTGEHLIELIDKDLSTMSIDNFGFIITGDFVDSPTKEKIDEYNRFKKELEKRNTKPNICVVGNHDLNKKGLAILHKNQKLADFLGDYPKIQIVNEIKTIFLLFNSNTNGSLAAGKIGKDQMEGMETLYKKNSFWMHYRLIAVLHHHITDISKPNNYKATLAEKLLPSCFLHQCLDLEDREEFLSWLKKNNIKVVLHGHKHVPIILKHDEITIISCGSSTGNIKHKERDKTYISYNLLNFTEESIICNLYVEEEYTKGSKSIETYKIDY